MNKTNLTDRERVRVSKVSAAIVIAVAASLLTISSLILMGKIRYGQVHPQSPLDTDMHSMLPAGILLLCFAAAIGWLGIFMWRTSRLPGSSAKSD